MRPLLLLFAVTVAAWPLIDRHSDLAAQVRPVYDLGAAGLIQVLERLQTTASALHTGAHPDDEDSAFVARTARGDHARVAYLSLTRGEGGQNVLGPELFDALGVIRTEELLQARKLDGGAQFFTRAIDFGFSKTRAEAAAKWGERDVLDDMVRIIRSFRPLVIVSRFSGTEADGHGHHQLAGYLTPLAFRAAAGADEFTHHFTEGLRPWQAKKLYRTSRQPGDPALVDVLAGMFDPVIGRTYAEIAAEGRSQHKSQEMGAVEPRGDIRSYVRLVERTTAEQSIETPVAPPREQSIFDGMDTSIRGIAALAGLPQGALRTELDFIADIARRALNDYTPLQPSRIVPTLVSGLQAVRSARSAVASITAPDQARAEAVYLLQLKEREFIDALARASGIVIDALSDQEIVAQGSAVTVSVRAYYPDRTTVRVSGSGVTASEGWTINTRPPGGDTPVGADRPDHAQQFVVSVPADAEVTQPYFLATPREGDRYRWASDAPKASPFEVGPLVGWVTFETGGVPFTVRKRVDYRFADRVRGEIRRNINVVPPITLAVDPALLVVPTEPASSRHQVVVTATGHVAQRPLNGTIRLRLPPAWTSTPATATFTLDERGDRLSTSFVITAPPRRPAGRVEIAAEAMADDRVHAQSLQAISYPHIETHRIYRPSTLTAQVLDLKVAPVRVGYVMGSGDTVADALRRMGVDVTVLDEQTLATGDLSGFDTIVVGVRASEARRDFAAEHRRLMQYVTRGGTLIVQYQQLDYLARNLPPFPGAGQRDLVNSRVTDETAPVRILAPAHPLFNFPNRITAADFDGWVQERNLYAFPAADPRYVALLESADPGEPPQRGGEVYAEVGKGRYVYTAFAWFRQLPAGVPGAYRQFANLISLSKAPR
jgi:LmbE family N-acetylglucosaminyl deacetylase